MSRHVLLQPFAQLVWSATPPNEYKWLLDALKAAHPRLWELCGSNDLWLALPGNHPAKRVPERVFSDLGEDYDSEDGQNDHDDWNPVQGSAPSEQWFLAHTLRPLGWENPVVEAAKSRNADVSVSSDTSIPGYVESNRLVPTTKAREQPTDDAWIRLVTLTEQPVLIRRSSLNFLSPSRKKRRRRILSDAMLWDNEGRAIRVIWIDKGLVPVRSQGSDQRSRSPTPVLPRMPPSLSRSSTSTSLLSVTSAGSASIPTSQPGSRGAASPTPSASARRRAPRAKDWTPSVQKFLTRLRASAVANPPPNIPPEERRRLPTVDQVLERISAIVQHASSVTLNNPDLTIARMEANIRTCLDSVGNLLVGTFGVPAFRNLIPPDPWPRDPAHLIELWAQSELYDVTFWRVSKESSQVDSKVEELRKKLEGLDLRAVGLLPADAPLTPDEMESLLARNLSRAGHAFRPLGSLRTPQEKVRCIASAVRALMAHGNLSESAHLTTDHLVPLLFLVLVRSGVPNLASNGRYLDFAIWGGGDEPVDDESGTQVVERDDYGAGELAFSLSTFEAVLSLLSGQRQVGSPTEENAEEEEEVEHGRDDAADGEDEEEVKKVYTPSISSRSFQSFFSSSYSPINDWIAKAENLRTLRDLAIGPDPAALAEAVCAAKPALARCKDEQGNTLLHLAVLAGRMGNVGALLALGTFDPACPNYDGQTVLHLAAAGDSLDADAIFRQLVDAIMELPREEAVKALNFADHDGNSALHLACCSNRTDWVELLCSLKDDDGFLVDVNLANKGGSAPLHFAGTTFAPLLARKDLEPNKQDVGGLSPLVTHARAGLAPIVWELVADSRIDLTVRDGGGRGIAHLVAYWAGQPEGDAWVALVKVLLDKGLDPNLQTIRGNGVLHAAADSGRTDLVCLTLGEDLAFASLWLTRNPVQLALLLEGGRADPTLRNSQGKSAADLARTPQIRDMLQAYLALLWQPGVVFDDIVPGDTKRALRVVATEPRPGRKDDDPLFVLVFGTKGSLDGYSLSRRTLDGVLTLLSPWNCLRLITFYSFTDFNLLRNNVLLQFPQALLPSIADLYSQTLTSPLVKSASVPTTEDEQPGPHSPTDSETADRSSTFPWSIVRKLERRINRFLARLYSNPEFHEDELLWEFAMNVPFHWGQVRERTQSKRDMAIEDLVARFQGEYESDRIRDAEVWSWDVQKRIGLLQTALRTVGASSKRALRARAELRDVLGQFRFLACRPDGVCYGWPASLVFGDALVSAADADAKVGQDDSRSISEISLDALHDFADVPTALRTYDDALRTYLVTKDKMGEIRERLPKLQAEVRPAEMEPQPAGSSSKGSVMDRLKTAVVGSGSRSRRQKIKDPHEKLPPELQGELDFLREQAVAQAAFLDHVDISMRASYSRLMADHTSEFGKLVDGLVEDELAAAKEAVKGIEDALRTVAELCENARQVLATTDEETMRFKAKRQEEEHLAKLEADAVAAAKAKEADGVSDPAEPEVDRNANIEDGKSLESRSSATSDEIDNPTVSPLNSQLASDLQSAAEETDGYILPTAPDRENLASLSRKSVSSRVRSTDTFLSSVIRAFRDPEAEAEDPEIAERRRRAKELLDGSGLMSPVVLVVPEDDVKEIEGVVTVLDSGLAWAVRQHLPRRLQEPSKWTLLYSLGIHGSAFSTFFHRVCGKGPTVWAIKTDKGAVFGAFVADDIVESNEADRRFYGTGEGFLWERTGGVGGTGVGGGGDSPNSTGSPRSAAARERRATFPPGPNAERVSASNTTLPAIRVCSTTLFNNYFIASSRSAVLFGGGGDGTDDGLVGLYLSEFFEAGFSDGRCPTFEMQGVSLGKWTEQQREQGDLMTVAEVATGADGKTSARRHVTTHEFLIQGLEVWSCN